MNRVTAVNDYFRIETRPLLNDTGRRNWGGGTILEKILYELLVPPGHLLGHLILMQLFQIFPLLGTRFGLPSTAGKDR
jgi:hypothetical protein